MTRHAATKAESLIPWDHRTIQFVRGLNLDNYPIYHILQKPKEKHSFACNHYCGMV